VRLNPHLAGSTFEYFIYPRATLIPRCGKSSVNPHKAFSLTLESSLIAAINVDFSAPPFLAGLHYSCIGQQRSDICTSHFGQQYF
jgi:hypothetical protein